MTQSREDQSAIDLVVAEEVTSKAAYERIYRHPEWPEGESGVTIAIGYDLGYVTHKEFAADWKARIPLPMFVALDRCVGVHGDAANALAKSLRAKVNIPWDTAMAVFLEIDWPKYTARTVRALPNTNKLPPVCLGVLVSLVYNRGASFNNDGDRYREMRAIKAHMAAGEFAKIPAELRSMKRLWPNASGLRGRRDREARLFETGLGHMPRARDADLKYGASGSDVEALQRLLIERGYHPGTPDGRFATGTRAAVLAFQADRNLPTTGVVDEPTLKALQVAVDRPVSETREKATADDLRDAGSMTIANADKVKTMGKAAAVAATVKGADDAGLLDTLKSAADYVTAIKPLVEMIQWIGSHWWIGALIAGGALWYFGRGIVAARLADHKSGANLGR
jgi:hypothetical protein